MLRILSPLTKLFTAKENIAVTSEGIENLGAIGFLESSFVPVYLRDSQVLTIWEGTTDVLCWDFVRALQTCKNEIDLLGSWCIASFNSASQSSSMLYDQNMDFREAMNKLILIYNKLYPILVEISEGTSISKIHEENLREIVMVTCHLIVSCLLIRIVCWRGTEELLNCFIAWVESPYLISGELLDFKKQSYAGKLAMLGQPNSDQVTNWPRPKF